MGVHITKFSEDKNGLTQNRCNFLQGLLNMERKKFLFISLDGLISDIAYEVCKEGHDVRYFIESETENDIADGFVPKVKDWESSADWADVFVFDDVLGQGEKAKALRDAGRR